MLIKIKTAQDKGLVEFYKFSSPSEKIQTQYGVLSIIEWLREEQKRISLKKGRTAKIVKDNGKVALFVNDVSKNDF